MDRVGTVRCFALLTVLPTALLVACAPEGARPDASIAAGASVEGVSVADSACGPDGYFDTRPVEPESEAVRAAELARIERTRGRVRRSGDSLIVRLMDGREIPLVDCLRDVEQFARHEFIDIGPRDRGLLLEVRAYEGGTHLWLDDSTGAVAYLERAPVYSRDSSRFVIANEDLEAGYSENVLEIWRVDRGRVERLFRAVGGDEWGASAGTWLDDSTVRFVEARIDQRVIERTERIRLARFRNGAWSLEGGLGDLPASMQSVLGVRLDRDSLASVARRFGPATEWRAGEGDESTVRWCYLVGAPSSRSVIEFGSVPESAATVRTVHEIVVRGADSAHAADARCAGSTLESDLRTPGGLALGMSRAQLERLLGTPTRATEDVMEYDYAADEPLDPGEASFAHWNARRAECFEGKAPFAQVGALVRARFDKSRVREFMIARYDFAVC